MPEATGRLHGGTCSRRRGRGWLHPQGPAHARPPMHWRRRCSGHAATRAGRRGSQWVPWHRHGRRNRSWNLLDAKLREDVCHGEPVGGVKVEELRAELPVLGRGLGRCLPHQLAEGLRNGVDRLGRGADPVCDEAACDDLRDEQAQGPAVVAGLLPHALGSFRGHVGNVEPAAGLGPDIHKLRTAEVHEDHAPLLADKDVL
mmetsp:Transcript_11718/g.37530  ORF Transcript_11718/g.37530 Transcript_11718/m.37530 type:complete len:201 (-) Transcript_11718:544-1146(-)